VVIQLRIPKRYGNKTVVIHANVLLALIDERDKWHIRASALAMALQNYPPRKMSYKMLTLILCLYMHFHPF
jgi:predicted nucleic acid-binding protein